MLNIDHLVEVPEVEVLLEVTADLEEEEQAEQRNSFKFCLISVYLGGSPLT